MTRVTRNKSLKNILTLYKSLSNVKIFLVTYFPSQICNYICSALLGAFCPKNHPGVNHNNDTLAPLCQKIILRIVNFPMLVKQNIILHP